MALAHDFHHIDARAARILLYEAAPRVLPSGFPAWLIWAVVHIYFLIGFAN